MQVSCTIIQLIPIVINYSTPNHIEYLDENRALLWTFCSILCSLLVVWVLDFCCRRRQLQINKKENTVLTRFRVRSKSLKGKKNDQSRCDKNEMNRIWSRDFSLSRYLRTIFIYAFIRTESHTVNHNYYIVSFNYGFKKLNSNEYSRIRRFS